MTAIKHFVVGAITGALICAVALLYTQGRATRHLAELHASHLERGLAEVRVAFEVASAQYHGTLEQQDAEISRLQQLVLDSQKREKELLQLAETQAGAAQSIIEQFPEVQAYVSTLLGVINEKDIQLDSLTRETAALRLEVEASSTFIRELIIQKTQLESSLTAISKDLHLLIQHDKRSRKWSAITTVAAVAGVTYLACRRSP